MQVLLLTHLVATVAMVGVILTVQLVVYPQFRMVPEAEFDAYHASHMRRIAWVVGPLMLIELVAAAAVVWKVPGPKAWLGLSVLVVIWFVTAIVQLPQHASLQVEREEVVIDDLVTRNWWRTALWVVRGGIAVWMVV